MVSKLESSETDASLDDITSLRSSLGARWLFKHDLESAVILKVVDVVYFDPFNNA